jgi:hypothetical protein
LAAPPDADGCWRLNEVKSSTRIKNEHLEEVALQAYVIAGNGLDLADACLVFVNNNYVRSQELDWHALFCREDVSENLIPLLKGVPERIARCMPF